MEGGSVDLGLRERVAIVTGGSKGLGRAEAEALAAEGAAVVVATAKSVREAEQVVRGLLDKGGRAICVQTDVTQTADVQRLVETTLKTFGRLDILVNNAGTVGPQYNKPLVDMPEDLWDFMLGNHLRSVFLCIKYAAPQTMEKLQQQIPLGRIGEPPEVGRVVAFLASEAASYLNGVVLDITGGRLEYFF
jgi:3-oxoacyl-[acyl-carrier protein] reductase